MANSRLTSWCIATSAAVAMAAALPGIGQAAPAYDAYTICAVGSTAHLLDPNGDSVHTWVASGTAQTSCYLLEDGSVLFPIRNLQCVSPPHNGAYPSGRFQKISWDGDIVWDYLFCDPTARAGYDVEPMPNGNILIPTDGSSVGKVFEVQPTGPTSGDIVWECDLPLELVSGNTYMNSVSYNPELDLVVVDMQTPQRKVVVIDHSLPTAPVVQVYQVSGSGRVHAAAWSHRYFLGTDIEMPDIDEEAMRLNSPLVVDNGLDRVVEWDWATSATTTIPYSFSDHEGSVQRLPNGNTLVTRGGSTQIQQIDDSGAVMRTINAPGQIQRAYGYGPTYPGLSNLFPTAVSEPDASVPELNLIFDQSTQSGEIRLANATDAEVQVRIFSVSGRMVHETWGRGSTVSFRANDLASGFYYVDVRFDGLSKRTHFVKVR
ncbi:MAG: T9SS type A sorting domain-containing protein [Candidatus Eisenbacteria bacterium]|uniref:T9SS type A sorting domain-containing protein n=1 Tax=Eiseniibacteriota bacterium TaxID=2212470 RepID=A0A956NKK9_UNCEI|nr:T9SS type A sorting domain-containing protein [Candidatus Eisenbacteria bacterium]